MKYFLHDFNKNDIGISKEIIDQVQNQLNFELPRDYLDVLKEFNGGEGQIGENSWLLLYALEDLPGINHDYSLLMEQIPDYFLFGKDSADSGFAFHKEKWTYHTFGLMSNFKTDPIDFCGNDFSEFLEFLYNQ